ncbi:MAG: CRISPR-associated helicase Cas3', partial [Planctomycetaceae bacterium]|nr:CRISPR-associated helicase Cas3' [Planctomycetaceae bacterium]
MATGYYAHTLTDSAGRPRPMDEWEPLEVHLQHVAGRAAEFARMFDAADWGRLAGLWHDLGKYSAAFQNYLKSASGIDAHLEQQSGRVDHSTAGAQLAVERFPGVGRLLAYAIAGHHAGLSDFPGDPPALEGRLRKAIEPVDAAPRDLLEARVQPDLSPLSIDPQDECRAVFQLALFTRMLFSCLVDADFLATEQFVNPEQSRARPDTHDQRPDMLAALDQRLNQFAGCTGAVNQCRTEILEACRNSAFQPSGLVSLTVPTGGGKTLASLAFGLQHAIEHGVRRVIYAIPFTSIIEQTAQVFRDVFQDLGDVVLEHHSNIDGDDPRRETRQSRLAAENWDAPLVVTTNVQFFESLFAARTSQCRKLHNLVGSVIILDEVQTLPVGLLRPVTAVLRELATDYRCSIVLCTATQPAIVHRPDFDIGLRNVREIIPDPLALAERMRRVTVHNIGTINDDVLVRRITAEPAVLCIVNTRAHAARLYRGIIASERKCDGDYHLSTLLCGQHRADVIAEIRRRLAAGQACRVISTQLIEAGVDVDFPVVYRSLTGIDSIAQAAGRCNREGKRPTGDVFVFDPVDVQPRGYLGTTAATTRELLPEFDDLLSPAAVHRYFELHYWKHAGSNRWDDPGVMECFPTPAARLAFNFRTAADRFRMIEET